MKSDLVKLLKKLYNEDSAYKGSPPWQLLQGLEKRRLILSDLEVADEDVPVLVKFFQTKQACKEIQCIEINQTCGASVHRRRKVSALSANDHALLKELLQFVARCRHLQMLTFHMVKLSAAFMGALGKALTASGCELRWLVFRSCHVGGDLGVREVTPFLCKLPLQVLAFEACKLTDVSWRYFASVLKARENCLDDLYWNSTLRADPNDANADKLSDGDKEVLGDGLVALGLSGNLFTGALMEDFARVLKKSYWLLGVNLAENQLPADRLAALLAALRGNEIIQAACLRGNPGLTPQQVRGLHLGMASRAAQPSGEEKAAALHGGYARLDLLPARVAWLLRTWMRLQSEEALADPAQLTLSDARAYSCLSYCLEPVVAHEPASDRDDDDESSAPGPADATVLYEPHNQRMAPFRDLLFAAAGPGSSVVDVSDVESRQSHHGAGDELDCGLPSGAPGPGARGESGDWDYWPQRAASLPDNRPPSRVSMRPAAGTARARAVTPTPTSALAAMRKSRSAVGKDEEATGYGPRYLQARDSPWRHAKTAWTSAPEVAAAAVARRPTKSPRTSPARSPPRVVATPKPWVPARVVSPPRVRRPSATATADKVTTPQTRFVRSVDVSAARPSSAPTAATRRSLSLLEGVKKGRSADKPKPKPKPKKAADGKAAKAEMKALTALSTSVLAATKNLEHVSRRLRSVAQSLSESALLNISAVAPPTSRGPPPARPPLPPPRSVSRRYDDGGASEDDEDHTYRRGSAQVVSADFGDMSFASSSTAALRTSAEKEIAQVQLADLVRQRMQTKLRSILSHELGDHANGQL